MPAFASKAFLEGLGGLLGRSHRGEAFCAPPSAAGSPSRACRPVGRRGAARESLLAPADCGIGGHQPGGPARGRG
jgi:hypothetical protein